MSRMRLPDATPQALDALIEVLSEIAPPVMVDPDTMESEEARAKALYNAGRHSIVHDLVNARKAQKKAASQKIQEISS